MNRSENINELAGALAKAQSAIESAPKDSENPFFKSHYADLAAVWSVARKPLSDNGLAVTQHPSADGNIVTIETVLCHSSGQWLSSQLTMLAKDASPQAIGSCITYLRRYALSSVLGIASEEDDDGNTAQSAKGVRPEPRPAAKPIPVKPQIAPGRAADSPPPSDSTPPATTPPAGSTPTKPAKVATANTRAAALDRLGCQEEGVPRNTLHAYLVALGWLDNEKSVEQWPYRFVPLSIEELEALKVGLASFSQNGKAIAPYQPHGLDPNTLPSKSAAPAPEAATPPPPPEPELPPVAVAKTWRDYVLSFGAKTKGKTLGSFSEPDLRAYIDNFVVRESVEDDKGVKHVYAPAIVAEQKALRAALDEAAKELAEKKG